MAAQKEKVLFVLTGPTAVGKTELSLRWAESNEAEIISCDSLLFYRGLDIGTAKPSPDELSRVPHHLVDVCELTERMDVTRYVAAARTTLAELASRGRRALVVGGSGFYLRAFFAPVADEVDVSSELRAEIEARLLEKGLPDLVAELNAIDPAGTQKIDTKNPRRVVRALERCRATGKTLTQLAAEFAQLPPPFSDWEVRLTRLDREPDDVRRRIEVRVHAMLKAGLVDEVRRLLTMGLKENPSAAKAIGYRETIDFIEGRMKESELAPTIIHNTHGLVKKQRTWFRTQLPPHRSVDANTAKADDLF